MKYLVLLGLAAIFTVLAGSMVATKTEDRTEILEQNHKEFENCKVWGTLNGEVVPPFVMLRCYESLHHETYDSCVTVYVGLDVDRTDTRIKVGFYVKHTLLNQDIVNVRYRVDDEQDTVEKLSFHSLNSNRASANESQASTSRSRGGASKSLVVEELTTFLEKFANADQFEFSIEDEADSAVSIPLAESNQAVQEFRERIKEVLKDASKDDSEQDGEPNSN